MEVDGTKPVIHKTTSYEIQGAQFYLIIFGLWLLVFLLQLEQSIIALLVGKISSDLGCRMSGSMLVLILFWGIAGVGRGGLTMLSLIVVSNLVPINRQGPYYSLMGLNVVLGWILGPTLGRVIADQLGWRWIFYLNLPFCAVLHLWYSHFCLTFPRIGVARGSVQSGSASTSWGSLRSLTGSPQCSWGWTLVGICGSKIGAGVPGIGDVHQCGIESGCGANNWL